MKSGHLCLSILALSLLVVGAKAKSERDYVNAWVEKYGGKTEVQMPDKTRCDVVTTTHAIEFDFAPKWAEAIGQSLNYGFQINKTPGVVLIVRSKKEMKHWFQLNSVIKHYKLPIQPQIWKTYQGD